MLSKRVQVLMDSEEYKKLQSLGKRAHKSLGEIIREAAKLYGERLINRTQRLLVVEKMAKLRAPVSDWAAMEKKILRARQG